MRAGIVYRDVFGNLLLVELLLLLVRDLINEGVRAKQGQEKLEALRY